MLDAAAARSFAAAAAYRASAPYRALEDMFARGATEAAAAALLADDGWVSDLIAPLLAGLAQDPWFEPPFRVARDRLRTGTVLFDSSAVSIAATVLTGEAPPATTVVVPGRLTFTRYVRAGQARLRLWDAEPCTADLSAATARPIRPAPALPLTDGQVVRIDGRTRGQILDGMRSAVVTLTVTLRAATEPYAREYAIADGALVRIATNDDGAARTQMLLGYLRHAQRPGAAACYAAATHDPAFFLRWAAMREWLATDAGAALPRLREMAGHDPHGEVRAAAAAMLARVAPRVAA